MWQNRLLLFLISYPQWKQQDDAIKFPNEKIKAKFTPRISDVFFSSCLFTCILCVSITVNTIIYILRTFTIDNFDFTCFLDCKTGSETHTGAMRLTYHLVPWGITSYLSIVSSCVKIVEIHILNWTFIPARILRSGSSNVQNNCHKPWTCKARYKYNLQ